MKTPCFILLCMGSETLHTFSGTQRHSANSQESFSWVYLGLWYADTLLQNAMCTVPGDFCWGLHVLWKALLCSRQENKDLRGLKLLRSTSEILCLAVLSESLALGVGGEGFHPLEMLQEHGMLSLPACRPRWAGFSPCPSRQGDFYTC